MRRILSVLLLFACGGASAQVRAVRVTGAGVPGTAGIGVLGAAPNALQSGPAPVQLGELSLRGVLAAPSTPGVQPARGPLSAPRADLSLPEQKPLERDPVTHLYGVTPEKRAAAVAAVKEHYGDDLLDLAAIGSRARGTAGGMKWGRPVHEKSDLDLVPLLRRNHHSDWDSTKKLAEKLRGILGFSVELHSVLDYDGQGRFDSSVPFYGAGYETYLHFSSNEAVRIPLDE